MGVGGSAHGRLMGSTVVIAGLDALQTECAKNLVLAGVNLTLVDDGVVVQATLAANPLLTSADLGRPLAEAVAERLSDINSLPSVTFAKSLDLNSQKHTVVVLRHTPDVQERIEPLSERGVGVYVTLSVGRFGCFWGTLHDHEVESLGIQADEEEDDDLMRAVRRDAPFTVHFPSFAEAFDPDALSKLRIRRTDALAAILQQVFAGTPVGTAISRAKELGFDCTKLTRASLLDKVQGREVLLEEDIARQLRGDDPVTAAVLGGVLSQEVRKAVTRQQEPLVNFVTFNGDAASVTVTRFA